MDLQAYLVEKFRAYRPPAPEVGTRNKRDITLDWTQGEPFGFLGDQLLYRLEKNNKLPKWIVVYSGSKAIKKIDNLEPRYPHRFRLKIILQTTAVPQLADMALEHYGDENSIYEKMGQIDDKNDDSENHVPKESWQTGNGDFIQKEENYTEEVKVIENQQTTLNIKNVVDAVKLVSGAKKTKVDGGGDQIDRWCEKPWLESQWSEETWTSTDTDGTSAVCFCMAVRCGYLKQVQVMLEERPELLGIVNSHNGFTPLATAVRKGDVNTVRFLLTLGAEVDQPSLAGQTALHLAVLAGDLAVVELLLEKGADFRVRDCNGLRCEHYAVDSCDLNMLKYVLERGGDVTARDYNGWTPLFRALCQGAKTEMVQELVSRGSDVNVVDNAGLPLTSVAKLLKNRHGRSRDSIMRLVDSQYPHEKALANFTRLSKKIYNVASLLKLGDHQ